LQQPVGDEKLFEIALGFITRSVLSNPVHLHQMEILLPDLIESINWAVTSTNGITAGDALALVNQYLLVGNFDLALAILQQPNSAALSTAMKHPR